MLALDNAPSTQPLQVHNYVETCVVEDNPWRKLFHSGTAGGTTQHFCAERLSNGAPYQFLRLDKSNETVTVATPRDDIEAIISTLKPSMNQLADAFSVSRQRIYDWRRGERISAANADRLAAILSAARMLNERCSNSADQIGDRNIGTGQTFWSALAAGADPIQVASKLLDVLARDDSERTALRDSLSGKRSSRERPGPLFSDYFAD